MGTEHYDDTIRHFIQLINKNGAALFQIVHHKAVMHHFMAHVDRRTEYRQGTIDDFDSPVYTGTETSRICQFDFQK
jgi:hypothetical protein